MVKVISCIPEDDLSKKIGILLDTRVEVIADDQQDPIGTIPKFLQD